MLKVLSKLFYLFLKIRRKTKMYLLRPLFKSYGRNFVFDPNGLYSFHTIQVGNDVYLGPGATLSASESQIILGNKIMFGPNVTIMGGDHNASQLGQYMYDVKEKLPENDLPVIIEDDVWIGTGVIILKGVTIGTGSIVGAGSVVTKSCPPYSIMVGVPAKVVKKRFSEHELIVHKKRLGIS